MNSEFTKELTLFDHLRELRVRVIYSLATVIVAAVAAYWRYDDVISLLYRPFAVLESENGHSLYATSLFEGFSVRLKISILAGVLLAFPFILYHVVRFVLPALRERERQFLGGAMGAGAALAVGGVIYGYCWIVPLCVKFMTASEFIPSRVGLLLNFEQNIFYILQFLLIMVLVFQLPIFLSLLMALNLLSRHVLLKYGRHVVVLLFIVSAVITPPDLISQLAVALPLVFLYYLSILAAGVFGWGKGET
ncbi:MAG: twin-arginine translocase subunit TatC [Victivallaceae bacterium]|jgi:sec-independent protein translocase protein TatC|nr:twin-arginine translocase subunit TatC [Victivallaceae bacterium]MDD4318004.1 twin-arginine translocase subunit TatC [Victivallaceae bacterium]MDD5663586.1 twin-arginine translocase subunit TatC [Victivallaceae bacterium]NLK83378.1 twin-arginine translocase subunit TatC [Lentisphaerota bacterium]